MKHYGLLIYGKDRFPRKLVSFQLSVANTRAWAYTLNTLNWTNTLAYYGISALQISNVLMVHPSGLTHKHHTKVQKPAKGQTF
jgi:hypothetical protein